jgi:succinoglycan biosynthesis transport protein ExoP
LSELSPYFIERLRMQHGDAPVSHAMPLTVAEDQAGLREYWHVIRQHATLVATITCCALLISAVAAFTITPTYTASALILIEPQAPQVLDIKQLMVEQPTGEEHDYYKTQYSLLRSRSLAAQVIHELGLQDDPLLSGANQPKGFVAGLWSGFRSRVATLFHDNTTNTELTVAPEALGVSPGAVNAYLRRLSIQPEFGTRLVKISFSSPNAKLSAVVANAHADAYVQQGMDLRTRATQAAERFLEGKLVELSERVEKSEAALNSYRHDKGIVQFSTNGRNEILLRRLEELNSALTRAETTRINLESQADLVKKGDYYALPGVVSSPMVQALKPQLAALEAQYASMSSRYTLAYEPLVALKAKLDDTRAQLKETVDEIVRSVKLQNEAAEAREQELYRQVDREKTRALELNDASLKDAILAREVNTNRQLYESVLKRMKEMGVAAAVRASNVSLVDHASPPASPSSPRKTLMILLSTILGLNGAIGIAFLLEYLDDSLKTAEQVERLLRLPSLAFVPDMVGRQNGHQPAQLNPSTRHLEGSRLPAQSANGTSEKSGRDALRRRMALAAAREAYRTIRSQILLSRAGYPPRIVLISSAVAGEGKSITAVNTAITFAQKGRQVLLIDADLRRARCHELLRCDGRYGLSEVLTGQAALSDVISETNINHLFLLSAGSVPPDPPELLGSDRMGEILTELSARYQHIIIDSAPVMPISDSVVLSRYVDGVIMVVGRTTAKQLAKRACQRMSDAGAKVLGVVLNQLGAYHASYYSYHGYYDSYRSSSSGRAEAAENQTKIVFE